MHLKYTSRFALFASVSLLLSANASDEASAGSELAVISASDSVDLESSDCGSACAVVFGTVGEPFGLSLQSPGGEGQVRTETGLNAFGEPCVLPQGLAFDPDALSLRGVPRKPGSHEFVLLVTEKGRTRERVVLIDIQPAASVPLGDAYASYFFGGVR